MYSKIKNILNGVNLLIVEDDENLRESIKISVENYVSEAYACANAKEALEFGAFRYQHAAYERA